MGSHSPEFGRIGTPRSQINTARTIAATENRMPNAVAESTPALASARPIIVAMP